MKTLSIVIILLLALPVYTSAVQLDDLNLPDGFEVNVYAEGIEGARFMAMGNDAALYITLTRRGQVVSLIDKDKDGFAETKITVATGLDSPHGIAFHKGYVYIAETGRVLRFAVDPKTKKFLDKQVIVPRLPTDGGGHFTRTLAFGPDGYMYVSIGSSCNICEEKDKWRAAIIRFMPDGSGGELFAEGLRNSVGIVFHPITGELFASDNARDWLGDDLPPDEINIIKKSRHYGWPYCHGNKINDPKFDKPGFCKSTEPPIMEIQAHSAPLGLRFYAGKGFPDKYKGNLFIALHGSWNRTSPTGYKIIRVPFKDGLPSGPYEDFITGWLKAGAKSGRPVDIIEGLNGEMFISDDYAGVVYRVIYKGIR